MDSFTTTNAVDVAPPSMAELSELMLLHGRMKVTRVCLSPRMAESLNGTPNLTDSDFEIVADEWMPENRGVALFPDGDMKILVFASEILDSRLPTPDSREERE